MKLSDYSTQKIGEFIAGDADDWPYRSGPKLVAYFNKLGFCDVYGQGFPSRGTFAKEKIAELNGQPKLKDAFRELLDPRLWREISSGTVEGCAAQVNEILRYDGFEVVRDGNFYKVRELSGTVIEVENRFAESEELSELLIEEQIQKCREKIDSGDYSGAITNARSLVEAVCTKIEADLDPNALGNDGDLIKIFNRVRKLLNLDPSRQDINESLKQVLSGLSNVINGLAAIRNKMSDAHGVAYKPSRHHAKLAVNAAKTLADFLFDTMAHQIEKGSLKKN
jgi:hypothetical protein